MKIGVVTFFDNGNYGSELQAFALSNYLTQLGHVVWMCRFQNTGRISRRICRILDDAEIKLWMTYNAEYRNIFVERTKNAQKQRGISSELRDKLSHFSKAHLKSKILSPLLYSANEFDCWICGSDQIWSALRMPFQKERFLTRVPSDKKIAYAVSLGLDNIPSYWRMFAKTPISKFKHLSFREQVSSRYAKDILGVDSQIVVDPTLLVGRDFWDKQLLHEGEVNESSPYCVCYFLGDISQATQEIIKDIAAGRNIIVLPYKNDSDLLGGEYFAANPLEFVSLIKNADFVFTDSFHGTVFSILYNRDFLTFKRSHLPFISQTNRIGNLLEITGIDGRFVDENVDAVNPPMVDWEFVNKSLNVHRTSSELFLMKSLKEVESGL